MEKPIEKLVGKEDWRAALFALRINIFSLALLGFWTPLNNLILPDQVSHMVPDSFKGTALGVITFLGIGIATVVQPIAGRIDDRLALPQRRKTFIAGGTAAGVLGAVLFGLAPAFLWLLLAYIVMQVAMNVAQAAFQALIPDLVKPANRGLASGIKDGLGVLGAALGLVGVGLLIDLRWGFYVALAYLIMLLIVTAYLTVRWVPDIPPPPKDERITRLGDVHAGAMFRSFQAAFKTNRVFRLAVVSRFLFLLGLFPVERLFLYYLQNRFQIFSLGSISLFLVAAIALAAISAWVSGTLSDRLGRVPVLKFAVVLGTLGVAGVAFAPWLWVVGVAGACVAAALGAFQSVNWAQMADVMPQGSSAEYYGLSNLATAGSGAIAGLFGPLADLLSALLPTGTYAITFGLAALIAISSLIPLRRLH